MKSIYPYAHVSLGSERQWMLTETLKSIKLFLLVPIDRVVFIA